MALRAIAFDIDGTLYSSPFLYLRLIPFALRNERLLRAFGMVRAELHGLALNPEYRSRMPHDRADFCRFQAELLAPRIESDPGTAESLIARVIYGELEEAFSRVKPYRGLREALATLQGAGLRLAALSDFPARAKLDRLGLGEFFEFALCSEDSGLLKPAAEPFIDLAEKLDVSPSEILYVGNSLRYDIKGARGAGMRAALRGRRGIREAEFHFTDWSRFASYVLALKN